MLTESVMANNLHCVWWRLYGIIVVLLAKFDYGFAVASLLIISIPYICIRVFNLTQC